MMGLPVRLNSACTSSNWRSSIRLCSLMTDSSGFEISSDMFESGAGRDSRATLGANRLGQFEFLELGLDRDRVLGFGDYFFSGYHAGKILFYEERVQRDHAIFCARLDVGLDTEG